MVLPNTDISYLVPIEELLILKKVPIKLLIGTFCTKSRFYQRPITDRYFVVYLPTIEKVLVHIYNCLVKLSLARY